MELRTLFSKLSKSLSKQSRHSVERINLSENTTKRELLKSVLNQDLDAVVVEGFLSQIKSSQIVNSMVGLPNELKNEIPFGMVYGKTLVGSWGSMEEYFVKARQLNEQIIETLELDILKELKALLNVEVSSACVNGDSYAVGTIRSFYPQKGGLHAHAEAEFVHTLSEFNQIKGCINIESQINYLLILQEPEGGGELVLYDLRWNHTPNELKADRGFYNHYEGREAIIDKYRQQKIPLKVGDLVLFNGINIWHGVKEVTGKIDRITFAGFLAKESGGLNYVAYN